MPGRARIDRALLVLLAISLAMPALAQEATPQFSMTVTPDEPALPNPVSEVSTVTRNCSRWYAGVDVLWLARDFPQNTLLAQTVALDGNFKPVPIPGAPILTLGNVSDGQTQAGLRVWMGHRITDITSVELGYFGLQQWTRSAGILVGDPPFASSPYLGSSIIYGNKSFDTSMSARYSSEVHSAEANVRTTLGFGPWNASALGGLRYFNLSEQFGLTGFQTFPNFPTPVPVSQTIVEQTRVTTSNNLFGAQIGGEVGRAWLNDRFGLAMNGKVGIFANNASQFTTNSASLILGGGGTTPLAAGRGSMDFASLYEGGLTTTIRVTSRIRVRAGYQVLFVQGLALAPTQLFATGNAIQKTFVPVPGSFTPFTPPATTLPAPGTGSGLNTNGNVFLHGPSVGLDISY